MNSSSKVHDHAPLGGAIGGDVPAHGPDPGRTRRFRRRGRRRRGGRRGRRSSSSWWWGFRARPTAGECQTSPGTPHMPSICCQGVQSLLCVAETPEVGAPQIPSSSPITPRLQDGAAAARLEALVLGLDRGQVRRARTRGADHCDRHGDEDHHAGQRSRRAPGCDPAHAGDRPTRASVPPFPLSLRLGPRNVGGAVPLLLPLETPRTVETCRKVVVTLAIARTQPGCGWARARCAPSRERRGLSQPVIQSGLEVKRWSTCR